MNKPAKQAETTWKLKYVNQCHKQCVPTPIKVLPGSNPGRRRELVQNHVAMSRYTNWPPKLSTNMVIDYCTLNIQSCFIHFCVRSATLIKMVYHLLLYDKCTISYCHICTQILNLWVANCEQIFRQNCHRNFWKITVFL